MLRIFSPMLLSSMEPLFGNAERRASAIPAGRIYKILLAVVMTVGACSWGEDALPFAVSNPKHKKWPPEEAARIYVSACDLVARTVRPEKPPHLRPKFILVLGSDNDEFVNLSPDMEVHLKSWNPTKFAEAVALVASRDVVQPDEMRRIVVESVALANSTVSVRQLKQNR